MNHFERLSLITAILLFSWDNTHAQKMKFGKYTAVELALTEVNFEPEANSVVLEEYAKNQFMGGILHTTFHRRIKVLKESGKSIGDVSISYYFGNDGVENVSKINAQIMNIVNGKEEIIKLSKKDLFEVDAGNGYKEIRFTFPNVKEGSILEYEYLKVDKNITFLNSYVFQNDIPTIRSSYWIDIPSYLNYRTLMQGNKTLRTDFRTQKDGVYQWSLTNLRSIKGEPYMNHFADYLERVEFQLAGYTYRDSEGYGNGVFGYKEVLSSWQELAGNIRGIATFDSYLNPDKAATLRLKNLEIVADSELERAKKIYKHVIAHYKFNDINGDIPLQTLKTTLEIGKGSKADINLNLLAHLAAHDIPSSPVLISSKGNGRSQLIEAPFAGQFNHLVLMAKIEGKEYFLDATDPQMPFGHLPLDNHTGSGLILLKEESRLIPIKLFHRSGITQIISISPDAEGKLISETTIRYLDYDAVQVCGLNEDKNSKDFKKEIFENVEDFLDYSFSEKDEPRKVADIKVKSVAADMGEELLFINPFKYTRWNENPFVAESRVFPIDFNYTFTDHFSAMIQIPEGFELDDFPEEAEISIPGGAISFTYKIAVLHGMVKVNSSIDLKNNLIESVAYPELKYLMEIVTGKLKEPVVLKKTSRP